MYTRTLSAGGSTGAKKTMSEYAVWRKAVTSSEGQKVFEGLEAEKWEWRTVGGLSSSTGVPLGDVKSILSTYAPYIQVSSSSTESGEHLYTLKSRYYARRGPLQRVRDFLIVPSSSSGSSSGL